MDTRAMSKVKMGYEPLDASSSHQDTCYDAIRAPSLSAPTDAKVGVSPLTSAPIPLTV